MNISFNFQEKASLPERLRLRSFLVRSCRKEGREIGSLSFVFCSDPYLLDINRSFLKHNYYTDIITFDLGPDLNGPLQGEIYISVDRVKENAVEFGVSFKKELHRIIFHGVLHLCGYTDKNKKSKQTMTLMEDKWLTSYFK